MQIDNNTRLAAVPLRNGAVVLSGYGVTAAVERKHLSVSDGAGRHRRASRFAKATSRLKRLVVIAQTGFVTLEALRWLHDMKAAFIHLDCEGSVLSASVAGLDDARLRRAQALIPYTEYRATIARELLATKINGQSAVLNSFSMPGANRVREAISLLESSDQMRSILLAEAQAAEAYWDAWTSVAMAFARRDHVPDHWRTFKMRRSPITLKPRSAANPINAMLNYLYTLLEVETRLALISRGLDPGLALFHADEANRQSLAADVMEPVRPHVDAFILNLARTRTFTTRDFVEARDGTCRLAPSLSHELATTMSTWAELVAPHAESVARQVAALAKAGLGISDPMHAGRKVNRASVPVRRKPVIEIQKPIAVSSVPISVVPSVCRNCGAKLTVRKRLFCNACLPERREETKAANAQMFRAAGPAKLAAMRAAGKDPTISLEARKKRSSTASAQRKAVVAWNDDGSLDLVDFKRDILPKIQDLPVRVLAEAMRSSTSHGSKVRNGHLIPHKRHWKALSQLA